MENRFDQALSAAESSKKLKGKPLLKQLSAPKIIFLLSFLSLVTYIAWPISPEERAKKDAEIKIKQEQKEAEIQAKVTKKAREDFVWRAISITQSSMRDPDSFKLDKVLVNKDASVICIAYRAKNGFGGYEYGYQEFYNKKKVSGLPNCSKEASKKALFDFLETPRLPN